MARALPGGARAILLAFALLSIAAVAAQTWWDVRQDRHQTLAAAHEAGLATVRLLDEHATQTLADAERNLDAVVAAVQSADSGQLQDDTTLSRVVTGGQRDSRFLNALQFVSLGGKPYVNSAEYPAFQFDIEERTYVAPLLAAAQDRRSRIGRPFQRFYDKAIVLPLARNLFDKNGRHLGIISIDINVAYFSGVYGRISKDSDALVALYADQGYTIVRSPFDLRYLGQDIRQAPALTRIAAAGTEGVLLDDSFLAQPSAELRQYTFRKLPGYGITTIYARTVDSILADWLARMRNRSLLAAAASLLICTLAVLLAQHIRRAQASEQALRESEQRLEQRVAERTDNLAQAYGELQSTVAALTATQKELMRSEKMAALGSLVAGVAHELNTPLGNGVTMASALQDQLERTLASVTSAQLRRSELLGSLAECANASAVLTRNLLRAGDLVQKFKQVAVDQSAAHRRRYDLAQTLGEIIATLEPMYKHRPYRLETELEAGITMDSFPGALAQIITNLVSNAVVHAFPDGRTGVMRLQAQRHGDDAVTLVFSDDGPGIPPEVLPRVFDPFFTTRMGQGGTGLGMHIVYNLVTTLLGGQVEVASSGGCRVTITLPLSAPDQL